MNTTKNYDIPKDFDWSFYLENHPDLINAGIKTEELAISHYHYYGKKEERLYKSTTSNITDLYAEQSYTIPKEIIDSAEIVLFVQFYASDNTKNIIKCLEKNIENNKINKIHIFYEHDSKNLLSSKILSSEKCCFSNIKKRLAYSDWIIYADINYKKYIKILANSDIYFDETISLIKNKVFSRHILYAITRKDLSLDGEIVESHDYFDDKSCPTNPLYSHDAWIYYENFFMNKDSIYEYFDFDLGKGNCDRLFKKFLNVKNIKVHNLYPEINAIHIDYRKNKQREYYDLNFNKRKDIIKNISNYLTETELIAYTNNLECINLMVTSNEIDDGQYADFLSKLETSMLDENNAKIAKTINFRLTRNNTHKENIDLTYLKQKFKSVDILYVDIPDEYNHYNLSNSNKNIMYGNQSGPLYSFFSVFKKRILEQFNTSLFLECDVIFCKDWLYNLYNYCKFSGPFLISGSNYNGHSYMGFHDINSYHINGGVCLYATGSNLLSKYMEYCFDSVPVYVKNISINMPYDYIIYYILTDNYNYDLKNRNIMKFLKKNFITNNLIVNYCNNIPQDIEVTAQEIIKKYNPAIIHKK